MCRRRTRDIWSMVRVSVGSRFIFTGFGCVGRYSSMASMLTPFGLQGLSVSVNGQRMQAESRWSKSRLSSEV